MEQESKAARRQGLCSLPYELSGCGCQHFMTISLILLRSLTDFPKDRKWYHYVSKTDTLFATVRMGHGPPSIFYTPTYRQRCQEQMISSCCNSRRGTKKLSSPLLNATALENIVCAPNCRIIEFIEPELPEKLLRHVLQRYSYFAAFICFVCMSPVTQSAESR